MRSVHARYRVAAALLPLVVLAGCSGSGSGSGGGSSDDAPKAEPTRRTWEGDNLAESVATCGDASAALLTTLATQRVDGHEPGAGYSPAAVDMWAAGPDGSPVVFREDGTRLDAYGAAMSYACERFGNDDTTLAKLRDYMSLDGEAPTCASYLSLDPAIGATWIALEGVKTGQPSPAQDAVTALCAGSRDMGFEDAVESARQGAAPAAAASAMTWQTTSNLGYTADYAITLGPVQPATQPHPGRPEEVMIKPGTTTPGKSLPPFSAEGQCGIDPASDAVIPVTLTVTNTTAGYETPLAARFVVRPAPSTETVQVGMVTLYDDEVGCADNGTGRVDYGVKWDEPAAVGYPYRAMTFVILYDYYSPRYPEGNVADLARIVVEPVASPNAEDPVTVSTTSGAVHVDGTPAG